MCVCVCPSARGVSYLFDIQVKTFNSVYDGKDLIGQARTGTGKTFSFAVPLVEKLQSDTEDRRRGRAPKVSLSHHTQQHSSALWVLLQTRPAHAMKCTVLDTHWLIISATNTVENRFILQL